MDTGGPRREFFRLLAMRVRDGRYFQAGSLGSFFLCNTEGYRVRTCLAECLVVNILVFLLQANHYKILGSYAALSIIQGGPGFPFFHSHVYAYLCTGTWSPVTISVQTLPNHELRAVVKSVRQLLSIMFDYVVNRYLKLKMRRLLGML